MSSIIEAGTAACRLYGPSKTSVADIARLLGKSPASVCKIFPSKSAIWNAIAGNFFETDLRFTHPAMVSSPARRAPWKKPLGQHRPMLQARDGDSQDYRLPGSRLPLPRQMPGNFAEKIGGSRSGGSRQSAGKEQPPVCSRTALSALGLFLLI